MVVVVVSRQGLARYRCGLLPCCKARIPDTPPTIEFPWTPPPVLIDPPATDPPTPTPAPGLMPACCRLVGTTARLVTVPLTWVAGVDKRRYVLGDKW